MSLDYGIHLGTINPKAWVEVAEEADRLGFASLWMPEHVVIPLSAAGSPHSGSEHPPIPSNTPMFDALSTLNYLAAKTSRIRLGTHVYNIGLRHPMLTARAAATLDLFSGGRLNLGIGSSWCREEWEALGLDFDSRGARVDEAIDVCRRLWTEDVTEHHGRFFDFSPTQFLPKPVQPELALHIGGDGPAALRRAATVGAGWIPMNHSIEDLPPALAKLKELTVAAGRDTVHEITVGGDIESPADIERYTAAGVTCLLVRPYKSSKDAVEGIRRFAERFIAGA